MILLPKSFYFFVLLVFFSSTLKAEIGVVTRVIGGDAVIFRDSKTIPIYQDSPLEEGDRIETKNSVTLLQIYPSTQISLSENSVFTVDDHDVEFDGNKETSNIIMSFLKGKLKILVNKLRDEDTTSQTIKTKTVALAVRGTEFEVEENEEGTNVDVVEGRVAASNAEESVELKKDDSIAISHRGKFRLAQGLRKGHKIINQNWRLNFFDGEKARQRWRERRGEVKNKFYKLDPVTRNKIREEKRLKRAAKLNEQKPEKLKDKLKDKLKETRKETRKERRRR